VVGTGAGSCPMAAGFLISGPLDSAITVLVTVLVLRVRIKSADSGQCTAHHVTK
jgi:hypothetical protein